MYCSCCRMARFQLCIQIYPIMHANEQLVCKCEYCVIKYCDYQCLHLVISSCLKFGEQNKWNKCQSFTVGFKTDFDGHLCMNWMLK